VLGHANVEQRQALVASIVDQAMRIEIHAQALDDALASDDAHRLCGTQIPDVSM
jgi:hypothetical protein